MRERVNTSRITAAGNSENGFGADTSLLPSRSLPQVFNLIGEEGNFESSPKGQPAHHRSCGFWSSRCARIGDIVVRPIEHEGTPGTTLWEITSIEPNPFTGSDSRMFWNVTMKDIIATTPGGLQGITESQGLALERAGILRRN